MRVAHLAKYYPPEWGGMERVTHDLAQGMAEAGIASHVIAFTRDPGMAGEVRESDRIRITRCPLLANPANQPLSPGWVWQALKGALAADAVVVHGPNLLALPVMALLALLRLFGRGPASRVLLWHSDIVDKGMLGTVVRPFELVMAALSDRIIATSPPYAAASPVLRRFAGRVTIVPLGIDPLDPATLHEVPDDDLTRWIGARRLILSVGRLVPYKGFDVLIEAMAALRERADCCCVIVGTGPERPALDAQIAAAGVADAVRIVGPLPAERLQAFYRQAFVYCMSSRLRSEAFGVVLLEAMSHGLPLVVTQIAGSGVPWVAGVPDDALGAPVEDSAALARALATLLDDSALAHRLGAASARRFADQFTKARMVALTTTALAPRHIPIDADRA